MVAREHIFFSLCLNERIHGFVFTHKCGNIGVFTFFVYVAVTDGQEGLRQVVILHDRMMEMIEGECRRL